MQPVISDKSEPGCVHHLAASVATISICESYHLTNAIVHALNYFFIWCNIEKHTVA